MITSSFDSDSRPVRLISDLYGPRKHICSICIPTFSSLILKRLLGTYKNRQVSMIMSPNGGTPIYLVNTGEIEFCTYLSPIGSVCAATDVYEASWLTGAHTFIMSGSAGSLVPEMTSGKFVIPVSSYRDDGISYHYAPPSDYIDIPCSSELANCFDELGIPYVKGKIWTTDALYMETVNKIETRRKDECIAVEMEISGVQAVCSYYGIKFYCFLETGDVVLPSNSSTEGLKQANHGFEKMLVCLKIAGILSQKIEKH